MTKTLREAPSTQPPAAVLDRNYAFKDSASSNPLRRMAVGGLCLALGLGAAGIGLTSVYYRLTHMTVRTGIVNGRTVRIQAPVDGTLRDFYGQAGASVQASQVLAQLKPMTQAGERSRVPQMERQVKTTTMALAQARQALALLNQQQSSLTKKDLQVQQATQSVAADDLSRYQAALDAAIAQESAAQADYARFQSLLTEGAVSAQQVDQLKATWQAAQAAVNEAKAQLESGRTMLAAARTSVPVDASIDDLQERQEALAQEIQAQETAVEMLTVELANQQAEIEEAEGIDNQSDQEDLVQVTAPFAGVVYTTRHEAGEQVSRPETLLTLLDCNDLWIETIINANQANRVDTEKPVRVKLTGSEQTIVGQVAIIEAVSAGELTKDRAEALLPAVPSNLINQPLARVRVNIPTSGSQPEANQFCGLGQNAQITFGMHAWKAL
ncbi:MAG: HlyD family secretion protein [Elainellaceae cyanobacterium]